MQCAGRLLTNALLGFGPAAPGGRARPGTSFPDPAALPGSTSGPGHERPSDRPPVPPGLMPPVPLSGVEMVITFCLECYFPPCRVQHDQSLSLFDTAYTGQWNFLLAGEHFDFWMLRTGSGKTELIVVAAGQQAFNPQRMWKD